MPGYDRVRDALGRHRRLFDLARDGLGAGLCKAATDGVQACLAGEHDPGGTPWAPLSEKYDEWKSFQFPGNPISLLHGVMDDPREVAGVVGVRPDLAEVTYGTSGRAREEARWFQEGNAHQPPRPFWGFTAESLAAAGELLDARFDTA